MWWIYALLSAFFASLTAIFAKLGVANVNSNVATAVRTVVVLFLIWTLVFIRGETKLINQLTRENWFYLIISGLATGLSWLFYFKALQLGKVSLVAPIDKLSVALTLVFAVVFLGESLTIKSAIGAIMILGGTVLLIGK
ncbi:MAG: EamA family transporter [Saprospiraceae bacterium]|nr:EamA family transporter [Saprospiraceae bacterium]